MSIRTYQSGDELAQVSIYNECAASFPKFKPAVLDEVRRRLVNEADPSMRFYAIDDGRPVGYATLQFNGRMSYPWCRKGYESWATPLFEAVLQVARQRGIPTLSAAYRADWDPVLAFFQQQGFVLKREMLNYLVDLIEMPTPAARSATTFSPLLPTDIPQMREMAPTLFQVSSEQLLQSLLHNPYFPPDSLFTLRGRDENQLQGVGIIVANSRYANPRLVDAAMPCFRLGAFGTEGLTHKRINGLFSFVVANPADTSRVGLDLLGHAVYLLQETQVETVAAQIPSDVPHLIRFYQQYFRTQGRFPVLERKVE